MATAVRAESSVPRRLVRLGRPSHGLFSGLVFVGVLLITGVLGWLIAQGVSWAWPPILLTIVYGVGAVLYRLESSRRFPGWLAQTVGVMATVWPPIKWLRTSEEVQSLNEAFVDDFNRTLDEYLLERLDPKRSEELAGHVFPLTTRSLALAWVREHPDGGREKEPPPSADALELLHHERSGGVTINVWQARREQLIDELVPLIRRSRRVPAPDPVHPYTDADVRALLDALRDFDIELIAAELRAVNRIGGRLQRYAEFLAADGASKVADVTALIAAQELGELPAGPSTLFRLESPAETLELMKTIEGCDDEALGAVHRGIFLAERDIDAGPLKARACAVLLELSAGGATDPTRTLQAYLWEKDQRAKGRRAGDRITLDELDRDWPTWSRDAEADLDGRVAEGFAADLSQLAQRLEAGVWPTRRSVGGEDGGYPPSEPVPVAGHEEVRDLDAYMITFDDRHGALGKLVDGLRKPGSIYRFGPYTRNARLGIVPHGMPFHEFVDRLLADLDDALHRYLPGFGEDGSAGDGVLRFAPGRPHSILLRHDHECKAPAAGEGPAAVEFEISEPLRRCNSRGAVAPRTVTQPADGQLGRIERWPGRRDRALVRYFPESVAEPRWVCFTYTSTCGEEEETHQVRLLVGSKRRPGPLDQIEVTVNRIDLAHCRELWFGDPALRPVLRPPSIYDVWRQIEPDLDRDEREPVKAAFEGLLVGRSLA